MLHHFRGRDFLKLGDFTPEEVAIHHRHGDRPQAQAGDRRDFEPLRGKAVAVLFEKKLTAPA